MAELVQRPKPPNFSGHTYNFICDLCFAKCFLNFKRINLFLSVPDFSSTTMINYDSLFFIFQSQIESSFQFIILYFYGQLVLQNKTCFKLEY